MLVSKVETPMKLEQTTPEHQNRENLTSVINIKVYFKVNITLTKLRLTIKNLKYFRETPLSS